MKKFFYSTLLIGLIALSTGCGKNWLSELANNPNQPSQAPGTLILPPILTGYASWVVDGYTGNLGTWMGYYSFSGGYSVTEHQVTYWVDNGTPNSWDGIFGILKNANYLETNNTGKKGMENFVAVGKILKALGFQYLVDAYNLVPYSQAFKGAQGKLYPAYDKGQAIYDSCIAQLDDAMTMISKGLSTPGLYQGLGSNDVMFQGDMKKWLKFANTLKLRFLIRESKVISASDAKAEIQKTDTCGYLTEDAMVNPGYSNSSGKQSPLWGDLGVDPGGSLYSDGYNYLRGGKALVSFLKSNHDNRLYYIYAPDGSEANDKDFFTVDSSYSDYHGVYYGDRTTAAAQNNDGTVGVGHGVLAGYDASVALITAAESYFLQAEAVQRGWMSRDAKDLYQKGITASFEYFYTQGGGKTADADADAAAYYSQSIPNVGWAASTNKIEAIIVQKWVASAMIDNFEAWCDYRRTGYPGTGILPLTKYNPNQGRHIPTKFMYPKSESGRNTTNYNAAVAKGNDPQSSKIFWMK